MFRIRKEIHPEKQRPKDQKMKNVFCQYPVYTSCNGLSLLEIRNENETWRSKDNGVNWTLQEIIQAEEKLQDGVYGKWSFGPFFHDFQRDVLIQFIRRISYRCLPSEVNDYHTHVKMYIKHSLRIFYRISTDGGFTWDKQRQLIEDGDEYDEQHYAQGCYYGENSLAVGEIPPYLVLDDGTLMLPYQGKICQDADQFGSIQAGRFFGKWDEKLKDYHWTSGGRVPGGGCEQTIARLKDGRLMNILRVQGVVEPYYFDKRYRPYSISEDNGITWSEPGMLCWDDGENIISPRAWSQLIRAENGRLYWIANILPDLDQIDEDTLQLMKETGNGDPRYPLVIAEVDESNLTIKRDSATTIIDRKEGETKFVRFSNFYCYNDRVSGEIIMYMMKSYQENQPNLENMPHPAWRFKIKVT